MQRSILKSTLSAAIAAASAASAIAAPISPSGTYYYTTTATSYRNWITVQTSSTTSVYYVDYATAGTASDKSRMPPLQQPIDLVRSGDWTFNVNTGVFYGNIAYGNYMTQTNVTSVPIIDGRQTLTGVNQAVGNGNAGTWVTPTHFTYSYMNATVNGGGASVETETSSSCANGTTSPLGKVCTAFTAASKSWEGISVDFYFSPDYMYFSGILTATDTSGSGLTRNTTTIVWAIDGIDPPLPSQVPVPTTAWMLGSGLIGLAAARRRQQGH